MEETAVPAGHWMRAVQPGVNCGWVRMEIFGIYFESGDTLFNFADGLER